MNPVIKHCKTIFSLALLLGLIIFGFPCSSEPELKETESGELIFKAKTKDLWFNNTGLIANDDKFKATVEVTLPGVLFKPPKEINLIKDKNKADRNTIEGLITSYISATNILDAEWIASHFVDEEKEQVKSIFNNKDFTKQTKKTNKKTKKIKIIGKANYKEHTIVFVEQELEDGEKVTEAISCIKKEKVWKMTNSLSQDRTFDIVYAALFSGNVYENKSMKDIIKKPDVKFIR